MNDENDQTNFAWVTLAATTRNAIEWLMELNPDGAISSPGALSSPQPKDREAAPSEKEFEFLAATSNAEPSTSLIAVTPDSDGTGVRELNVMPVIGRPRGDVVDRADRRK
jgi:hypothetical protein